MSEAEKQATQYFLDWIKSNGLTDWVKHFLDAGDEAKLRQIKEVYDKIKSIFGFQVKTIIYLFYFIMVNKTFNRVII